jgi:hypothetical protein
LLVEGVLTEGEEKVVDWGGRGYYFVGGEEVGEVVGLGGMEYGGEVGTRLHSVFYI